MADASKTQRYSREHQYELLELTFYRLTDSGDVPDKTKWIDMASMMEELDIYEDIMSNSVTGQMLVVDGFNMPDRLPIVGGERLKVRFRTASFEKEINQTMVIYKVGERMFSNNPDKAQMYWLFLCTEDAWNNAQLDVSFSSRGTYDSLIKKSLEKLNSKKTQDLQATNGIASFIAPYWSPLKICSYAATRSVTDDGGPMFFWETTDAYMLKSLDTMFKQAPQKKIFIEDRKGNSILEHADKLFNTVMSWNYAASDDKLTQNRNGDFGTDVYIMDTVNWNISRQEVTKDSIDIIRIDKFPITDSKWSGRSKTESVLSKPDGSEQSEVRKRLILDKIDNKRIVVELPGDSSVHAGQLIDLDVPSMTGQLAYATEKVASGNFLAASVRHILVRDRYKMNIELLKNATEKQVV